MIKGIGTDLVEIERIKKINPIEPFLDRILTSREKKIYHLYKNIDRQHQFLAGRFAAKEAFSKAYGTGIGVISFTDIEIINDEKGKPILFFESDDVVHISISHTEYYATATVIIESK